MNWGQYVRGSIKRKFIVLMVTVMLSIVSTIGIVQYVLTSSMLTRDLEQYNRQILEQANWNIGRYLMEYDQAFMFIEGSDEFYQWTRQQDAQTSTYLRLRNMIYQNSIQPFVMQHPEVLSISLLNPYGNELIYNPIIPFKLGYSLAEQIGAPSGQQLLKPAIRVKRSDDYATEPLVVLSILKELDYYGRKAYIQMEFSVQPMLNILNLINDGGNLSRFVMDEEGTIVAHPSDEQILTTVPEPMRSKLISMESGAFMDKKSNQFVVFASLPNMPGWKSVIEFPYRAAAHTINVVRNITLAVTGIGIGLIVVLIFILSSSLTNRIILLKKQFVNLHLGRIEPGPEVGGADEIAQLGQAYNNMLRHLDASIDELAHTRMREQTAIFTAVQSQIHSHFLYNSLETINSMASIYGIQPIEQAVHSLSSMIRYSSRIRNIAVTLGDEVEHTRHYLQLANIRFEGVTFQYKIDPAALSVRCPKLILQPSLENAIKHNVEKSGLPIHIDISVRRWRNRWALIRICDDGKGISPPELANLRHRIANGRLDIPEEDQSIGLQNVAYRINQFYGRYGLQAKLVVENRRFRSGARVLLILPILPTDDETKEV